MRRGRREFPVHHIDYDRTNVDRGNLVTLCDPCHGRTNANRAYWEASLSAMMIEQAA